MLALQLSSEETGRSGVMFIELMTSPMNLMRPERVDPSC